MVIDLKKVAANTGLPTGKAPSEGFAVFREFLQIKPDLHVTGQVRNGTTKGMMKMPLLHTMLHFQI